LSLREKDPEKERAEKAAERQRPDAVQACIEPSIDRAEFSEQAASSRPAAIASTPSTPPRPAAGTSTPRPAAIASTPSAPPKPAAGTSTAASSPGVEPLTDGQRQFLASLTPEQRTAFDAMNRVKQTAMLNPHAIAFNPIFGDFQRRTELKPSRQTAAPLPLPDTFEELIRRLPGGERAWIQHGAEIMRQKFGSEKDGKLWMQFVKVLTLIHSGHIHPNAMLHAYHHATKKPRDNPGAYWWTALQDKAGFTAQDLAK